MYLSWLDRWDEKRVQRGNALKARSELILDADRAFPGTEHDVTLADFCTLAEHASDDPTFFERPATPTLDVEQVEDRLTFPSDIQTDIDENNTVWARATESGTLEQALIVFHHWNAQKHQRHLANYFSKRGITVIEMAMPYHFERRRSGSVYADYMLSANIGRTVQSVRQAVLDGRKLVAWLKGEGYGEVSVLGMSLGSWVAGLVAAHDENVSKASLFLTAGSLADMVWTGRATEAIRQSLQPGMELADLRMAWSPINQETYARQLARPGLDLQLVLAKRDTVVVPELSHKFIQKLRASGAHPDVLELNCGHYSLALPPHVLFAGLRLRGLLKGRPTSRQNV
ncbi:abhydrolase domain-containing 18 [Roseovarius spongiae]|uniref:Abhydrolase domain-containing 18 n=1 Tax=Roseovarius spongiae TaxID=2320272 RepID=A0A3A8AQ62_9RHOB|nr:alpha/beta hydrolase family protein [Roseovarius spongiae]RKF12507.1 abhydrolase domain-containing 18 [Roseovarius spongiae]